MPCRWALSLTTWLALFSGYFVHWIPLCYPSWFCPSCRSLFLLETTFPSSIADVSSPFGLKKEFAISAEMRMQDMLEHLRSAVFCALGRCVFRAKVYLHSFCCQFLRTYTHVYAVLLMITWMLVEMPGMFFFFSPHVNGGHVWLATQHIPFIIQG